MATRGNGEGKNRTGWVVVVVAAAIAAATATVAAAIAAVTAVLGTDPCSFPRHIHTTEKTIGWSL